MSLSRGRATAIRSLAITPDLLAHALQNPEEPIRAFLSADVATIVTDANVWDTPDALPAEQFLSLCGRKLLVVRTHEDTGTPSFRTIVAMDHGMLLPYPHATHGSCTIQATVSGQKSTSANRAPHTAWDPNVYKRRLTAGKELTAEVCTSGSPFPKCHVVDHVFRSSVRPTNRSSSSGPPIMCPTHS